MTSAGATKVVRIYGDMAKDLKDKTPMDEHEYDSASITGIGVGRRHLLAIISLTTSPWHSFVPNALYIGVDSQYNDAANPNSADWEFLAAGNVFCTLFIQMDHTMSRICAQKRLLQGHVVQV